MLILGACTTTHYVPVVSVRTDSVYLSRFQRDSIFLRDSIFVQSKGDTISITKDRFIYHYKTQIDTVFTERLDTVAVIVPIEKQQESIGHQVKTGVFAILILSFLIALFTFFLKSKKG